MNTSYNWAFLRDGIAIRLARLAGARTLLHLHGGDFPEWAEGASAAWRRFIAATLRKCDRLIAITVPTQRWLEREEGPERVRYLPNFVSSGAARLTDSHGRTTVLARGSAVFAPAAASERGSVRQPGAEAMRKNPVAREPARAA